MKNSLTVLAALTLGLFSQSAFAAPGNLDPNWGSNGTIFTSAGSFSAGDIRVGADGAVYSATRTYIDGVGERTLVRRLRPSDGNNGGVTLDLPGGASTVLVAPIDSQRFAVVVNGSGAVSPRLYIVPTLGTDLPVSMPIPAGVSTVSNPLVSQVEYDSAFDRLYVRFNSSSIIGAYKLNGTPDLAFGTNGAVNIGTPIGKIIIGIKGRILLATEGTSGCYNNPSCGTFGTSVAVVRLLSTGSYDAAFGVNGVASGGNATKALIAVRGDGSIMLAGQSGSNTTIYGFNGIGQPLLTYGFNGVVVAPGVPFVQDIESAPIFSQADPAKSDDRLVFLGSQNANGVSKARLMATNNFGLDYSFGTQGVVEFNNCPSAPTGGIGTFRVLGLEVDRTRGIYVSGTDECSNTYRGFVTRHVL